ncbi:MAG: hypothetical protein WA996_15270, partial [Candidatus Promineifilaceae bacterium]
MKWLELLNGDPLPWLLEPDPLNPSVRYLTLRDIIKKPQDDPGVIQSKKDVMSTGAVPAILEAQHSDGYWVEAGPGYYPKYRGTVWQILFLAQFGADGSHPKIHRACDYVLANNRSKHGGFSINALPSGMIHCLAGNLGAALIDLGKYG